MNMILANKRSHPFESVELQYQLGELTKPRGLSLWENLETTSWARAFIGAT